MTIRNLAKDISWLRPKRLSGGSVSVYRNKFIIKTPNNGERGGARGKSLKL